MTAADRSAEPAGSECVNLKERHTHRLPSTLHQSVRPQYQRFDTVRLTREAVAQFFSHLERYRQAQFELWLVLEMRIGLLP